MPHSVEPFGVCCIRLTQGYLLLLIVASSILCASCPLGGVGMHSPGVSIAPLCHLPQCLWPASRAGGGLLTHPLVSAMLHAGCRMLPVRSDAIMGLGGKLGCNIYFKGGRRPKQLINKSLVILTRTEKYSGLQECYTPCWGSPY